MFRYDLYVFDRASKLIVQYFPFEAASQAAAIRQADGLNAHCPMELWADEALVKRWPLRAHACGCARSCLCPD